MTPITPDLSAFRWQGPVQQHPYSVPYTLIREQMDTRATARTIEVFHRGKRVAAHARRYGGPRHGTQPAHAERAPALCGVDAGVVVAPSSPLSSCLRQM